MRRLSLSPLQSIKLAHTIVWVAFVCCILAIWYFAFQARYAYALLAIGVVLVEVVVLAVNGWRCPLTAVAARYTRERRDNFDIYLPDWLARHNKLIFGALYAGGIVLTFARWLAGTT